MSNKPVGRFVFRDKESNKYYECGLLWPSKREGYNPTFSPNKEAKTSPDGTRESITFSDALQRVEAGSGFINIYTDDDKILSLVSKSDDEDF